MAKDNKKEVDDWEEVPASSGVDDWEEVPAQEASPSPSDEIPPAPKADVSKLESGLRGGAQGLSMGFADEITGGLGAVGDKIMGKEGSFGDLYRKNRDESRANYALAEQANPKTFMAGQIGGGIAPLLIPGGALVKGGGLLAKGAALAKGGQSVKELAALGALAGLGGSNAELTGEDSDLAGALKDTALGGAGGVVAGAAGKAISALPGALKSGAENMAVRSLGFGKREYNKLLQENPLTENLKVNDLGRLLLDKKALPNPIFGGAEARLDAVEKLSRETGEELGDIYSKFAGAKVDTNKIKGGVKSKFMDPDLADAELKKITEGSPYARDFFNKPEQTAGDAKNLMMKLDDAAYGVGGDPLNSASAQEMRQLRKALGGEFDEAAKANLGEDAFNSMKKSQNDYGLLESAKRLANNQATSERSNSILGGGLYGGLAVGASLLHPGAIPSMAAGWAVKKYGTPIAAKVLNTSANIMNKAQAGQLGKFSGIIGGAYARGESAGNANHWVLYNTNPEYRKLVNAGEREDGENEDEEQEEQ